MKRLILDIETAPNTAHIWGLFKQNIGINQILASGYVMCWAAKWYGEEKIYFSSINRTSPKKMLKEIHKLLDEADAVIHYNGKKFDIPTLNKEFVLHGFKPPLTYKQIDLYQVVRSTFRFASNKLDYVLRALGIGEKVKHEGHELWIRCLNGDQDAWDQMEEYNIGDVKPLEALYERILPWIYNHPNHALYANTERPTCTNCGSSHVIKKGFETTKTQRYQRYVCKDCGTPLRGRFTTIDKDQKENILVQAV